MKTLRQLSEMLDFLPVWAQFAIAAGLIVYSFASIFGRINVEFGAKFFSKIPKTEIRTNKAHIFQYTVIPLAVTAGYVTLLLARE